MSQTLHVSSPGTVTIGDMVFTPDVPPVNHIPTVNAGSDQSITSPTDSITLSGSATDPDTEGSIKAYIWTVTSGTGIIQSPTNPKTQVTGLIPGTSTFRLTATDDTGASGFDDINIIVHDVVPPDPSPGYQLIYQNGADSQKEYDPFGHNQGGNSFIDTKVFFEGTGCFHSRPANVSNGCRGEIQFDAAQTPLEGAVEYMVMYNYVVQNQCHSLQWHPSTSGGSGSPAKWHENGRIVWKNWIKGQNLVHSTGVSIPIGAWIKDRIEYKFGANGYFRHYMNDKLICSWTGQVGDNSSPYFKWGFNGNFDGNLSEAVKSDICYDSLKVYKFVG